MQKLLAQLPPDHAARTAFIVATSACWKESDLAERADVTEDKSAVLIRGTKRTTRYRTVPVMSPETRSLLAYALEHAQGKNRLFAPWSNVRRDLADACERAKITPCSPNDLRRTFAKWMRNAGVPVELIAPAMGHADTRMVERVYGRLSADELAARFAAHFGSDCCTGATDRSESTGLAGLAGQRPEEKTQSFQEYVVPRDGIEPPTRGFSVLCSTD